MVKHLSGNSAVRLSNFGYMKPRARILVNHHPWGGGEQWGVHQNSSGNLERAIVERVFTVKGEGGDQVSPPQPLPGVVRKCLMTFRHKLLHMTNRVVPLTTSQFVESYTGRKRRLYQSMADTLEHRPLSRKDAYVSSFIKDEKTNLTRKEDPCPRVIQPRSARFNIEIGKHLKPMEKEVFRGIARVFRSKTVMKGLNALERGSEMCRKWTRFEKPVAILLDATRFDQHCNRDIISWEHEIEERMTLEPQSLRRLNSWRRVNRCFARASDGAFKYTLRGGRMSGDMDTAMGNCLTMCAMTWSFMTEMQIEKFEYANDGDDGVLMVEQEHLAKVLSNYAPFFLSLGFTMKLEGIAYELEHIEFCQSRPVFDGEKWRMLRDPRVCIGKDSLSLRGEVRVAELRSLRSSIGWCGLALAGDMPIFWRYYQSMATEERLDTELTTGMQFLARGMESVIAEPSQAARLSFYRAYGISPDSQLAIEHDLLHTNCNLTTTALQVDHYSTTTTTEINLQSQH